MALCLRVFAAITEDQSWGFFSSQHHKVTICDSNSRRLNISCRSPWVSHVQDMHVGKIFMHGTLKMTVIKGMFYHACNSCTPGVEARGLQIQCQIETWNERRDVLGHMPSPPLRRKVSSETKAFHVLLLFRASMQHSASCHSSTECTI